MQAQVAAQQQLDAEEARAAKVAATEARKAEAASAAEVNQKQDQNEVST